MKYFCRHFKHCISAPNQILRHRKLKRESFTQYDICKKYFKNQGTAILLLHSSCFNVSFNNPINGLTPVTRSQTK